MRKKRNNIGPALCRLSFGPFIHPYKTAAYRCEHCGLKCYSRVPGHREAVNRLGIVSEIGFTGFNECQHCKMRQYVATTEDGVAFTGHYE